MCCWSTKNIAKPRKRGVQTRWIILSLWCCSSTSDGDCYDEGDAGGASDYVAASAGNGGGDGGRTHELEA